MPRHPTLSGHAGALPSSVLARLLECCAGRDDIVPFHVGNTYLAPPPSARLDALADPGASCLYSYAGPRGEPALVQALADKLRQFNGIGFASRDHIQITCGAIHALTLALQAVCDPGDDLLVLTPHWPMIRGVASAAGVRVVEAPSPVDLRGGDAEELVQRVADRVVSSVTARTSAIYLSNPNNPDGHVYTRAQLAGVARAARRHGLWIISDEVYEAFTFDGRSHCSIASLPEAADRTLSAYSFSKSYAQAGLRVGYLVAPAEVIAAARSFVHHGVYNVPLATQRAALAALTGGDRFLADARAGYEEARNLAVSKLAIDAATPEGGTYLFLDLRERLRPGERDALPLLERLAREGVLLVPGYAFGRDYGAFARLCFSAVPPGQLEAGLERLNRALT